ncbi:hypothetical protein PG989_012015 [Apiospora arundinis]
MEHHQQQQYQQQYAAGPTTEKMPAEMHPGGHGQQHMPYHQQQQQYPQSYSGVDPHAAGSSAYAPVAQQHTKEGGSKGIRLGKALFYGLVFLLIALLALAIGFGASWGQSQGKVHDLQSQLDAAKSSASPTVFITVTPGSPTSAGATPTSTSSSSPTGAADKYSCLSNGSTANNTQYTSSASSASQTKFNVYCGMDFGDGDGAKNLDVVNTTSVPDCLDACARTRDCQGAGWGSLPGDVGGFHHCYMKTNLSKSHGADKGWTFAVLDSVPVTISGPSKSK